MARQPKFGPHRYEYELGKRKYSFEAQVDKIVANTKKRMMLVMKQSISIAVEEMQTPVAKGGKMRVDTGFLRASGQSSLNGMPTGIIRKPKDAKKGQFDDGNRKDTKTEATIAEMKFGSVFYFGWTANYAKYREAYDGFMYATVQRWQEIVNSVTEEAKKRFPTK